MGKVCPARKGGKLKADALVAMRLVTGFCMKSEMVRKLLSVPMTKLPEVALQVRVSHVCVMDPISKLTTRLSMADVIFTIPAATLKYIAER